MKKFFKCFVAMSLAVILVFSATSCSKQNDIPNVDFVNPLVGLTYNEIMAEADEINEDRVYSTEDNNTFEITSIKSKKIVVSGKSVIVSAVTMLVAFAVGGFYSFPGVYYADKNEKILEVKIKYTNNTSESVMIGDVLHVAFAVEDEKIYNGSCCFYKNMDLDFSCTEEIDPGKTKTFQLLFDGIPKELIKNHSVFDIVFDVEGKPYSMVYVG